MGGMKNNRQLSHDILNLLERLRIMHDIAIDGNYQSIGKDELEEDLKEALRDLAERFDKLLQ